MGAQLVRFGLSTLVSDKRKNYNSAMIHTVREPSRTPNEPIQVCFEPRKDHSVATDLLFYLFSNKESSGIPPRRCTSLLRRASVSHTRVRPRQETRRKTFAHQRRVV
jgi:hypothetical protein